MSVVRHAFSILMLGAAALLPACSGGGGGGPAAGGGNGGGNGGGGGAARSAEAHFDQNVKPALAFCRTCHVPEGLGDVEKGKNFMLSRNGSDDFAQLKASWQRLGGNNPTSRILLMASGAEKPHSGGAPWPADGADYRNMDILLRCFGTPAGCDALLGGGGGDGGAVLPLLGSRRGKHVWETFCEGDGSTAAQPDTATLPRDPRTLVQAGVNEGKAVYFNAFWENCHVNLPADQQMPKTCGEYRERRDRGFQFLLEELPTPSMSAAQFNDSWKKWGFEQRPANFEALYTLRYGLNPAPFRNPYPLPGEDPKQTDGGSGQLPLGLRQMKDEHGNWNGQIGTGTCFACHGGYIGDAADGQPVIGLQNIGLGNNNYDTLMVGRDGSPTSGTPLAPLLPGIDASSLFNLGIKQRGQNNAVGAFELLVTLLDLDSLAVNPNPTKMLVGPSGAQDYPHPLAHTQDTPAWWNFGSRPRKFFDAGVSADSTRIVASAAFGDTLGQENGKAYRDRIKSSDIDMAVYFLSLESPPFPGPINTALAEQGAILFHTKDLWAAPGNESRPRPPGGNGSCASCHGAYSPRFVNDPNYLETPALDGVAGHISPLEVIGTDSARSDMLTPTLRQRWATTYWGYTDGVEGWVPPEEKDPVTELMDDMLPRAEGPLQPPLARPVGVCEWEQTVIGYLAPPLHGTWATAPYFHNGSVPTIEAVLDSSKRAPIWQRQLQKEGPVVGFDQSLKRAYDFEALGWKSKALSCAEMPGSVLFSCNPVDDKGPSLPQLVTNVLNRTLPATGAIPTLDPTPGGFDKRLVYDTRILGNGNEGHEFSDALTPAERRAILEYLKTL